jgi:predicted Ser/Thr protein kinase
MGDASDRARFERHARLGRLAVRQGFISEDQLRRALAAQLQAMERGERPRALGDLLVDFGYLDRPRLEELEGTPPPAESPAFPPLGKYAIRREIGRGASGVVYEALDPEGGRRVALKLLFPGPDGRESLIREAKLASKLPPHPGIVPVLESGLLEGRPYLALEYVEGRNLDGWLRLGSVTLRQFAAVVREAALALDHAHRHGVVHRDLKPENLLVDREGRPRVVDFGSEGALVGAPTYRSPEQVSGRGDVDARTDVWALGVLLYEGITGHPPFEGASPAEVEEKILREPPPPPSKHSRIQMNPLLFRNLENICLLALAKDPAERYRSAKAFARDLTRWLDGEEFTVPLPSSTALPPPRRAPRRAWIAGAAGLAAALVLLALFARPRNLAPAVVDEGALRPGGVVELYGGIHFNALGLRALDARPGFDDAADAVWRDGPEYYVSLRWSGYLRVPESGAYAFTLRSSEGARLRIGDGEAASSWSRGGEASGRLRLAKGTHRFVLETFHAGRERGVEVLWGPEGAAPGRLGPAGLLHAPAAYEPFGPFRDGGPVNVPGAQEGESLPVVSSGGVAPVVKAYAPFRWFWRGRWGGASHLWWGVGVKPGDSLVLRFASPGADRRTMALAMTRAMDHGVFRVEVNGRVVADRLDLYDPDLVTGEIEFRDVALSAGANEISFTALDSNPSAREWGPGGGLHKLGLDYLLLR